MTSTLKILMILTSHAVMGSTGKPTGVWFEELTTPYYIFADAGAEVGIASIQGGPVPVDPASVGNDAPASVTRFQADSLAMGKVQNSLKISQISGGGYDAVFLPGGHGTMWDMPDNTALAALLSKIWADGKVVAAVCHGPAGLLSAVDETGRPLVAGRSVSAFTNSEEVAAGFQTVVPFALESRIRDLAAVYVSGPDFQPFAIRDGRLVTGQNPASSAKAAHLTLEAVQHKE